jgi:hypothetical protein
MPDMNRSQSVRHSLTYKLDDVGAAGFSTDFHSNSTAKRLHHSAQGWSRQRPTLGRRVAATSKRTTVKGLHPRSYQITTIGFAQPTQTETIVLAGRARLREFGPLLAMQPESFLTRRCLHGPIVRGMIPTKYSRIIPSARIAFLEKIPRGKSSVKSFL